MIIKASALTLGAMWGAAMPALAADVQPLSYQCLRTTAPIRIDGRLDNSWDIAGLQTAVAVQGTLNQSDDHDRGWTVEIAYPLHAFASRQAVPMPRAGTVWRINFSRVEWTAGKPKEDNWVWSPQGVIDMHVPARWGYLHFSDRTAPMKN